MRIWIAACVVMGCSAPTVVPGGDAGDPMGDTPAAPGRSGFLDDGFGRAGVTRANAGVASDHARVVAVQADGKILVAGEHDTPYGFPAIARYLPSGTLDPTFGAAGIVTFDGIGGTIAALSGVTGLAVRADGKIVASISYGFTVVRLNADGSPDAGFGAGGRFVASFPGHATGVAVQPDGNAIAVGTIDVDDVVHAVVVRLDDTGYEDPAFGDGDGVVMVPLSEVDFGQAIANGPNGSIVIAGRGDAVAGNDASVFAARLAADGTLDPAFGTAGIAKVKLGGFATALAVGADGGVFVGSAGVDFTVLHLTAVGALDPAYGTAGIATLGAVPGNVAALALQPDGKLVLAGTTSGAPACAVIRLDATGARDAAFGTRVFDFGAVGARANGVAIAPDGTVVVAGDAPSSSAVRFGVARLATDGNFVAAFGGGGTGRLTTVVGPGDDALAAIAIAADGTIVAAGFAFDGTRTQFLVARFDAAGALDPAFGSGGLVTTALSTGNDAARGVAVLADGRIVVAGYADSAQLGVARYLPTGTLDPTFGNGGKIVLPGVLGLASAVASDGTIYVAGQAGSHDFAVAALDPSGALHGGFGASGIAKLVAGGTRSYQARAISIDPSGALVLAGLRYDPASAANHTDTALVRFGSSGTIDGAFGTGGVAVTSVAPYDFANAVTLQADGAIVVAGGTSEGVGTGLQDFVIERYLASGALDPAFGAGGTVTLDLGGADEATGVVVQPDGAIVVAGTSTAAGTFALARFAPDGALDATFGVAGITRTWFGVGRGRISAIARDAVGRLVVAGFASPHGDGDLAIARYWP